MNSYKSNKSNKIKIKNNNNKGIYTDEQLKYIEYTQPTHTKLLACAGSGKTFCTIARINRLIEYKVYKPTEILMLTFSRFTRDDFLNKIEKINLETNTNRILPQSIKTIDSFAKQIIDPNSTIDVSLLSYKFMLYLQTTNKDELKKNEHLKKVKTVFVDEAQDLNEIQYNIFKSLKEKLNIIINMVGDPNQNIYQFRDSSDKYLTEFEAITFVLTKNFRSHSHIVDFSKHLRPFSEHDVICTKGSNGCSPIIMLCEDEKVLEEYILDILNTAINEKMDLSDFAILSPTRGRMRGGGKSHGLCFVSNILYKARIPFKQFYEESTDDVSADGIKYAPSPNHVNVLTYMGSKGLEWKYVLVIDADMCLINKRIFTEEKHNFDRYLLYVACSRAIDNMFIFSKCYMSGGQPKFSTNPWFDKIPDDLYTIDSRFIKHFKFPSLKYVDMGEKEVYIGKLIDKLDCYNLNLLSDIIGYSNISNISNLVLKKKIFKTDYSNIEKSSSIFLSKFTESLFHAFIAIKTDKPQKAYIDIINIIETKGIITNAPSEIIDWYHRNRKHMTWNKFDLINKYNKDNKDNKNNKEDDDELNQNMIDFINKHFDRSREFNSHTMAINNYYNLFILNQKQWITDVYNKYINCRNYRDMRNILFDLMILIHSMDTQHYFHITTKGVEYIDILNNFSNMYDEMEQYVLTTKHKFISSNVMVEGFDFIGKIDMMDDEDNIWEIKCISDISLKNIIKAIMLNILKNSDTLIYDIMENNKEELIIKTNFINFLKGEEISYKFKLSQNTIKQILDIFLQINKN
jgi:hypothetical protein